jgi:hypothetical protein
LFVGWVADQLDCGTEQLESLHLGVAFDLLVCRVEDAARRNAPDPLAVVRNSASGGNSRVATRSMLKHLGYTAAQLRIVHRLLGGSPGGWPGLLSLYVAGTILTDEQRAYARRQLRELLGSAVVAGQERKGPIAS